MHFDSRLWVDFIMISSNLAAALFFMLNKSLMKSSNTFLGHIALLNCITVVVFCAIAVVGEDATIDIRGLFFWLDSKMCFQTIFIYGFFSTFFGSVGYLLSLQFYSPLVVMNSYMLEPVFAQIFGCMFGIDKIPSPITVFALLIVLVATFFLNRAMNIMINEHKRDGIKGEDEVEIIKRDGNLTEIKEE